MEKSAATNTPTSAAKAPTPVQTVEIETKFSVQPRTLLPQFTAISGVARVSDEVIHELSAVYFDTADLRLLRQKITLRRRTGGKDAGWHVKLPAAVGRREIHAPLGQLEFVPPPEIVAVIRPFTRGLEVDPIAQIDNRRKEFLLFDAAGNTLAEFVDDNVTSWSLLPDGEVNEWREWELELVDGDQDFLPKAASVLLEAGAVVSTSPSKLAMALGDSVNNVPTPPTVAQLPVTHPAAGVVAALAKNRDKIIAYDAKVRADEYDSIHQMRVATRELRSHMKTFEGILGGELYAKTERELKFFAGVLGIARDAEVVAARFAAMLQADTSGAIAPETAQGLIDSISARYERAHADVVAFLDSDRYCDLLGALEEILAHPPLTAFEETAQKDNASVSDAAAATDSVASAAASDETASASAKAAGGAQDVASLQAATQQAEEVLFAHLGSAFDRVLQREMEVAASADVAARDVALHDLRKATKRLRYSAEAAGKATSIPTEKIYAACKQLQEILGDFQDTVTSREMLRREAEHLEDSFVLGVLFERERTVGENVLDAVPAATRALEKAFAKLTKKYEKQKAKRAKLLAKQQQKQDLHADEREDKSSQGTQEAQEKKPKEKEKDREKEKKKEPKKDKQAKTDVKAKKDKKSKKAAKKDKTDKKDKKAKKHKQDKSSKKDWKDTNSSKPVAAQHSENTE